jgi:hypothetical protein
MIVMIVDLACLIRKRYRLLEPRRQGISPELLAAIQCNRRWIRAGFGGGKELDRGPTNEQLGAEYGIDTWDSH